MDELIGKAINALATDWILVAAIGFLGWKGLPWALRVHGHEAFSSEKGQRAMRENITNFFNNGGGEKVRGIVQSENALQTELHKNEITKIVQHAIAQHEDVEKTRLQVRLEEFRDEITGEFELQRAPRRRKLRSR